MLDSSDTTEVMPVYIYTSSSDGEVVIAVGGDGDVPLAEEGVDEAVDIGAVVVILLHDELRRVHMVHPGGHVRRVVIGASRR